MKLHAPYLALTGILVVMLCGIGLARADVSGTVIDAQTRQPLANAIVTADGMPHRSDAQGRFEIEGQPTTVAARTPGYLRTQANVSPGEPLELALTPFRPHAVYLSVYGIADAGLRDAAIDLSHTNGINALVIDIKGDRGQTPYRSAVRDASGATAQVATANPQLHDLAGLVEQLHREGLYLIARIVVFKDDPLARAHPELAVRDADGQVWRDSEQLRWVDPFSHIVWDHNIGLAEEAARVGFDEIQFDYVRFPDHPGLRFGDTNTREHRTAAIIGLLQAARTRLAPYNVFIAADIFGYVCWNADDTAIGQQIETLGSALDYISPMLYPSGFTWGLPGCTNPVANPAVIVGRSLAEARTRTGLPGTRFRPWLQAFRDYAFDHEVFDAQKIQAQIDAAEAAGTDGWMLWNPRNRYDPAQLPR